MQIPYGKSNFREVALGSFYYVDKTHFIDKLENSNEHFIFFLRPRRFGKSLFVSMLEYYYGIQYKDEFEQMFGNLYVGKNPTPLANSYLVLKFDFSRIETSNYDIAKSGFLANVKEGINQFIKQYSQYFTPTDNESILSAKDANTCAILFFGVLMNPNIKIPVYVMIDEYDHFANDMLANRYDDFTKSTKSSGFIRTFYEVLKKATNDGIVQRIFITGITPITLDSLTSGFNICKNRSTDLAVNEMMGFTEKEVKNLTLKIAQDLNIENFRYADITDNLPKWYDGYLFNHKANNRIFNPDMILYFLSEYSTSNFEFYPENIIDDNVTSDYLKIQNLFDLKDRKLNYDTLDELLRQRVITAMLSTRFNLQFPFTRDDFVSLLFYMGFVSIKEGILSQTRFSPPNYVIETLFYSYFMQLVRQNSTIELENQKIGEIVLQLANNNNITPLVELVEKTLQNTSNRDFIKFDEKHIKLLFIAYVHAAGFYYIKSEAEVNRNYPDLMLLFRPPFYPTYQFLFEFKYTKKEKRRKGEGRKGEREKGRKAEGENKTVAELRKEATEQLLRYAHTPETLDFIGTDGGGMKTVKGYVVIFEGDKAAVVEEIPL